MINKKHPLWDLRYIFFSKFDEWIKYDDTWLSTTKPEEVSKKIWKISKWNIVFDWFCWLGSNAIWFALAWKKVITCDLDKDRLEMAKHNAKIYWVQDKITFINWNVLDYIEKFNYDIAYFDPPWSKNGDYYYDKWEYNFKDYWVDWMQLINLAKKKTDNVIFALPKNFNFSELNVFDWNFILTREFINWELFLFNLFLDKNNEFSQYLDSIFQISNILNFLQDNFINISKELVDYEIKKIVYQNTLDYLKQAFYRTEQNKHQLVLNWYVADTNRIVKYVEEKFIHKDFKNLEIDLIKWLHKNLFPDWFILKNKDINWSDFIQMIPWEYRKINLFSKTNPNKNLYLKFEDIPIWLEKLVNIFNGSKKEISDILFFLADFFIVHPFGDWNWRVAYILTDLLLVKNWFEALYFWELKKQDEIWFYKVLDKIYETRNPNYIYNFIEKYKN